jgi:hypothetical protein
MKHKKILTIGEVFLSHANRDRRLANQVVRILRRHRVRVWYSKTHILGVQQWLFWEFSNGMMKSAVP